MAGSKSTTNLDQHTISVIRRNRAGGTGPKSSLTTISRAESTNVPSGTRVTADVTGLALVCEANDQTVSSVIAVTGWINPHAVQYTTLTHRMMHTLGYPNMT